jgi:hypothetical protein
LGDHLKIILLILFQIGVMIFIATKGVIAQDPTYHQFADARNFFGLPNFWNVLSNIPFFFVGIMGLVAISKNPKGAAWSWITVYLGTAFVCIGSSYYHLEPNNQTLVWDRLPMTIGFMGLFSAVISEFIDEKIEKYSLIPFLILGALSVYYWKVSGDLRPYVFIQASPLVSILFMFVLFKSKYTPSWHLILALVFYALAKAVEYYDHDIYDFTAGIMSGHAIKHVLAAMGLYFTISMIRQRRVRSLFKLN